MTIVWTKYWAGSDDGTILKGIDLRNIQDDLADVVTTDDPLTISGQTQGDIIYFNGTAWVRLGNGTDGQVLVTKGSGANPEWGESADLDITSQAEGDILYFDGTNWVVIPPGAAGTVLTSNGAGTAPSYQTPTPGGAGNVVFCFDSSQRYFAATQVEGAPNGYIYWGSNGQTTPFTVINSKFRKISSISTVHVYCWIWQKDTGAGDRTATCTVDIGGETGSVTGTDDQITPEGKNFTVDVSALSDDTFYDLQIQIHGTASNGGDAYLQHIIGIAT